MSDDKEMEIPKEDNNTETEPDSDRCSELKTKGNKHYVELQFDEALECYQEAFKFCPESDTTLKSILFANSAAAKYNLEKYESALEDVTQALALRDTYWKAYYRRGQILVRMDKFDEALKDFELYKEHAPDDSTVDDSIASLRKSIKLRDEALKQEMLAKLKDLGNTVLRPFGLSTDNFQLQKNPDTDGYSINFQGNK